MSRALLVFAKTPVAGAVKTRLSGVLGPEGARRLYTAFLSDLAQILATLNQPGTPDIHIRWHVSPDPEPLRELVGDGLLLEQSGRSLGARMRAACEAAAEGGYESVVVIGTDTPTLTAEMIRKAFEALDSPGRVVLGPATDGGYYLLGLRGVKPDFLEGVTYSRPDVLSKTVALVSQAGHSVTRLEELFDVDRPEDLDRLTPLLTANPTLAPETTRILGHLLAAERHS